MSVLANPTTKKKIHAMLRGNFWPVEEVDDTKEEVAFPVRFGTVPEGLEGHYVRNGPNNSFDLRAGQAYHLFDGDGMSSNITEGWSGNRLQATTSSHREVPQEPGGR